MKWLSLTLLLLTAPAYGVTLNELSRLPGLIPVWLSSDCQDTKDIAPPEHQAETHDCFLFGLVSQGSSKVYFAMAKAFSRGESPVYAMHVCYALGETVESQDDITCTELDPDQFYVIHNGTI